LDIEVRLYHTLVKLLPPGGEGYQTCVELSPGTTAGQALIELGVEEPDQVLIFVNGVRVPAHHELSEGDVLSAMLPAGGG